MKATISHAVAAIIVFTSASAFAAPQRRPADAPPAPAAAKSDPITENLFPPELVVRAADQLGLTADEVAAIRTAVQEARTRVAEAQQMLTTDTATLNELLSATPADTQRCLTQLDKVLDDERAVKRINLSLMLDIKGKLTAEQIAKLKQLRDSGKGLAGSAPEGLRTKMQDLRTKAQAKQQAGGDVSAVRAIAEEAQSLAQLGKFQEAEAKLDEAIKVLEGH